MRKEIKTYLIQLGLFVLTFITTTMAGMNWMGEEEFTWEGIGKGLLFSIPFLSILTVHEFGHYIASRIYKLKVTLPYYIPFYIPGLLSIGTLGAFIRIKSPLKSKREVMDVGSAGPLAGFILAMIILWYGFTHLPSREYVLDIHQEDYVQYGKANANNYEEIVYTYEFSRLTDSISYQNLKKRNTWDIKFFENIGVLKPGWREKPFEPQKEYSIMGVGDNLLFMFFRNYVCDEPELLPNKFEMYHYPFLFAGYLALFFTALNLLPIGQLDGGHIIYGLFGSRNHRRISLAVFISLIYFGGVGVFKNNFIGNVFGSPENLFFFGAIYLYFLYFVFSKLSPNWKNNLLVASAVFAAQYFTEFFLPEFQGISALYLFFGFLVGRFLGLNHPPTFVEEKVSTWRKIIGWISLIIFVISFTPNLFEIVTFKP